MIYLDNSATTKLSPAARDAMLSAMDETWGNPSSRHAMGTAAHAVLKQARMQVLSALGAKDAKEEHLIFTASGTEAGDRPGLALQWGNLLGYSGSGTGQRYFEETEQR